MLSFIQTIDDVMRKCSVLHDENSASNGHEDGEKLTAKAKHRKEHRDGFLGMFKKCTSSASVTARISS